jgi:hypothetical protein
MSPEMIEIEKETKKKKKRDDEESMTKNLEDDEMRERLSHERRKRGGIEMKTLPPLLHHHERFPLPHEMTMNPLGVQHLRMSEISMLSAEIVNVAVLKLLCLELRFLLIPLFLMKQYHESVLAAMFGLENRPQLSILKIPPI